MTILTVSSTNPELSYVLAKNPLTIQESKAPFQRAVRKGQIFGWFNKDHSQFRILFRDSELEASFSDSGDFEYLDKTRYSSPYLPIQIINESLRTAIKGGGEDTEGFQSYVDCVMEVPSRLVSRISFPSPASVEFTNVYSNFYKVKVGAPTVAQALNLFQMVCIICTLAVDDLYIPLGKDVIFKYLESLKAANAPYNLRQLFISRAITNGALFDKAVEAGLVNTEDFTFKFGNTQLQRLAFIKHFLPATSEASTLVDIGCGELSHSFKLVKEYENILAFEADPEICAVNEQKIKKRQVENVQVLNQKVTGEYVRDNEGMFEGCNVLLSEVLEHMPKKDAGDLLKAVLTSPAVAVLLTVPCAEFNQFYGMETGLMRHDDHAWEPTREEFKQFLDQCAPKGRKYEIINVGDVVKGIPCTLGAVFK